MCDQEDICILQELYVLSSRGYSSVTVFPIAFHDNTEIQNYFHSQSDG